MRPRTPQSKSTKLSPSFSLSLSLSLSFPLSLSTYAHAHLTLSVCICSCAPQSESVRRSVGVTCANHFRRRFNMYSRKPQSESVARSVGAMGWLRSVESIRLLVSFAKEPYKRDYSAKETYNLIDPTNRSHPICVRQLRSGALSLSSIFLSLSLFFSISLSLSLLLSLFLYMCSWTPHSLSRHVLMRASV